MSLDSEDGSDFEVENGDPFWNDPIRVDMGLVDSRGNYLVNVDSIKNDLIDTEDECEVSELHFSRLHFSVL